jgi:hypothetical protein
LASQHVTPAWAGPLPWFILAGWPVLGTCFPISPQSSKILSTGLSTATFVSDVVSTRPPAMAISYAAAAITDVLPVPVGPQLQRSRTAGGTAPAPTPPSAAGPALPHGGLGSREGFAPRRLRHDSVQRASMFRLGASNRYSLTPRILDICGKYITVWV